MKIKRIKVELSKTIQVTRFEPISVTYGLEADLEQGDNLTEAKAELYTQVSKTLRTMMKREIAHWKEQAGSEEE